MAHSAPPMDPSPRRTPPRAARAAPLRRHEPPRHRGREGLGLGLVLPVRQRRDGDGLPQAADRRRGRGAHPGHQPVPHLQVPRRRLLRLAAGRSARPPRDPLGAHDQRPAQALAVRPRHRRSQPEADQVPARGRPRHHRLRPAGLLRHHPVRAAGRPRAPGLRDLPLPDPAPGVRAPEGLADRRDQARHPARADRSAGRRLRQRARRLRQEDVAQAARQAQVPLRHRAAARSQRGDAAVEQEGAQALHRRRQGPRHRGRPDRQERLSAPGRVRRPVHPRDHGGRQPHLPLRAAGREGGHGRHRRSRLDPASAPTRSTSPTC